MNLAQLYKDIYETNDTPTEEELKMLVGLIPALPDDIFNAVFRHYVHKKTIEEIAAGCSQPGYVVERWIKAGVSLLKVMVEGGEAS